MYGNAKEKSGNRLRVLIVKIGAIGDVILALPMIEAIYAQDAQAEITWICGRTIEPLLRAFGRVSEIIVVDDRRLLGGNALQKAAALMSLWIQLVGRRFDSILTGHGDRRYRWLTLPARATVRRSFGRSGLRTHPIPGRFHSDEYVRLVTGYDGARAVKSRPARMNPPLPDHLGSLLNRDKRRVALAPGGARNILRDDALRRWPVQNYARLCERLLAAGMQVVVTGAPSDTWVRAAFIGLDVVDLVGETTLPELTALYAQCHVVITHDTGPLHLATLSGAHVIALFGPTNPHEKVSHSGAVQVLWGGAGLACRPCYDGKEYADCSNNVCMQAISVEAVFEKTMQDLEKVDHD